MTDDGEGTASDFAFAVTGDGNLSKSNLAVASRSGDPGDPGSWSGPPSRLHTLVVPSRIDPPVETRHQVLPFECLAWENFERFCLRLAIGRGEVVHSADHGGDVAADGRRSARDALDARLYGVRGQDQQGIDLYVRLAEIPGGSSPERRYLCLQSRRIAKLTAAKLKKAVSDFLKGKWPPSCRVFVYATSLAAVRSELADEIRVQTERLRREGIEFEVWDAELMSPWLKDEPSLVYDFFGRAWAESFCGPEAVDRLGTRLDAEAGRGTARPDATVLHGDVRCHRLRHGRPAAGGCAPARGTRPVHPPGRPCHRTACPRKDRDSRRRR